MDILDFLSQVKPKANVDLKFKAALFARLEANNKPIINFNFINFMNKFKFALSTVVVVAVVALVVVSKSQNQTISLPGKQEISRTSANAFGSLATLTVSSDRGQGGGGNALAVDESAKMAAPSAVGMGGGGTDAMMYLPINYKFVYKGDDFTIDNDTMPVYEREKGFGGSVDATSFLERFSVGLFDINKFANAQLDYITASQDLDHGYILSLDFKQGTVNIGENWEKWIRPMNQCVDEACFNQFQLSPDQVPSNDAIIEVANRFLDEYGIDRASFGAPIVQDMWRIEYARATDRSLVYIPDFHNVTYPTKIEGNEVYDQSGNKSGMYVTVDIRENRVSSVGELTGQRYQSSDYEIEKDTKRILGFAEKGGYQSYYPYDDPSAKVEEVDLGNPISGYVRLWLYEDNQSKELFVPSLIFPVTNAPDNIYIKTIIVPIVKEVLDGQDSKPTPVPLPMEKTIMQ